MVNKKEINDIQDSELEELRLIENESYIDPFAPMQAEPIILSSGSYFEYDIGELTPIAVMSKNNYSCIVGASKSKKSFLKSAILAVVQKGKSGTYFPNLQSHYKGSRYVIDIDTEQSPYHSKRTFRRTIRMVDGLPPRYRTYALRKYSPEQRLQFIHWLITASPYKGQIDLISIDGYADLVYDFNSVEQSNRLQSYLTYWTLVGNCHITGVLHKNFGSSKPVGHIGSAILKKAETVMFVNKDEESRDAVEVTCEYSRGVRFEDFRFTVNDKGLPYFIEPF